MREIVADTIDWHSRLLDKHEVEFAIMYANLHVDTFCVFGMS